MAKRLTHSKIMGRMWECGMPSTDAKYAAIFFAARKAGLKDDQAFALACEAFYASKGYVDHLARSANWLRVATLERQAAEGPRSLWAYLKHKLGAGYRYVTDDEVRDTSMKDHAGWSAWADSLQIVETA